MSPIDENTSNENLNSEGTKSSGDSTNIESPGNTENTVKNLRVSSQVHFLTVAEVASLMRVSKMTVYRLVHSGELPAVRVGKSFRVPEKAAHEYLQGAYFDVG